VSSKIVCVLGKVACGQIPVDVSGAAKNSTKWILDVCVDTSRHTLVEIELLDYLSGKRKESVMLAVSITPVNDAAWEARMCATDPDKPMFTLHKDRGVARYRICIDSVHTAAR